MLIRGDKLTTSQRTQVLDAFIYRWTTENQHRTRVYHCHKCDIRNPYINPTSANGHTHPTVPMISDNDWLAAHSFHFTKDGSRLMFNRQHAEPAYMAG